MGYTFEEKITWWHQKYVQILREWHFWDKF